MRDSREVTFQAALLYTSSKGKRLISRKIREKNKYNYFCAFLGERRIRVHTLCLPTSASVNDIINGADQQAVVGMLAKFGNKKYIF